MRKAIKLELELEECICAYRQTYKSPKEQALLEYKDKKDKKELAKIALIKHEQKKEDILNHVKTLDYKVLSIGGEAGTGKTTLTKEIVSQLLEKGINISEILLAAPTGTASKRLYQVLQDFKIYPRTIHSSIYKQDPDTEYNERVKFLTRDIEDFEVTPKVILMDEGSMVDEYTMEDVLLLHIPVVLIGDFNQLNPINGKMNKYIKNPTYTLTVCFRHLEDNDILELARYVNSLDKKTHYAKDIMSKITKKYGKKINKGVFILESHLKLYDNFTVLVKNNFQFISGQHRTKNYINRRVRELLGFCPTPHTQEFEKNQLKLTYNPMYPQVGDRIVCRKNVYIKDSFEVQLGMIPNGGIYIVQEVLEIKPENDLIKMRIKDVIDNISLVIFSRLSYFFVKPDNGIKVFDDKICKFDYAYCMTCHSAQGSEFPNVAVVVDWGKDARAWIYTAITRAKTNLVIADHVGKATDDSLYDEIYPLELAPFISKITANLEKMKLWKKIREQEIKKGILKEPYQEDFSTFHLGLDITFG
jgi:exodeoxyribonuclease-5